jgi:hypothetical protein
MFGSKVAKSPLGIFCDQLIAFFKELSETYPEERDIRLALEGIEGARKINPRLILDIFVDAVQKPLHEAILAEDEAVVLGYAKNTIASKYNEISPALAIFDKYWHTMSGNNRNIIWQYLKTLTLLAEKISKSA